jgi:hypothetical protein
MATYTFATKPQPTEPGQLSNFEGLVNDANHNAMTGAVGSGFQTVDISGTPIVSPATVSNSAVTTLTIPLNATEVNFLAATNTVNVSESTAAVTSNYLTIPVGVVTTLPVARMQKLYLEANTGSATVSFWFTIV